MKEKWIMVTIDYENSSEYDRRLFYAEDLAKVKEEITGWIKDTLKLPHLLTN